MTYPRSSFAVFLSALLAVSFLPASVHAAEKKGTDSELGKQMDHLGKAVKALKKNIKDPAKNEESLKLVVQAQEAALASKGQSPAMLAKAPPAEQPKLLIGYRKEMARVIEELAKLETQLLDGKNEEAAETLKKLKTLEEEGHEKYNP